MSWFYKMWIVAKSYTPCQERDPWTASNAHFAFKPCQLLTHLCFKSICLYSLSYRYYKNRYNVPGTWYVVQENVQKTIPQLKPNLRCQISSCSGDQGSSQPPICYKAALLLNCLQSLSFIKRRKNRFQAFCCTILFELYKWNSLLVLKDRMSKMFQKPPRISPVVVKLKARSTVVTSSKSKH